MFKEVFSHAKLVVAPGLALVLFFLVMCGAIAWAYRKGSKQIYQAAAKIPFADSYDDGVKVP